MIRGPGSAIYGAGAVSGVINIKTLNSSTFSGTELIVRQGGIDNFTALELKHTSNFNDGSGLFFYYGLGHNKGADQDDTPYVFGRTFSTIDGIDIVSGKAVSFNIANDNSGHRDLLKHKLHLEYIKEDFTAWFRLTRGGMDGRVARHQIAPPPQGSAKSTDTIDTLQQVSSGYQQLVANINNQFTFSDTFNLKAEFSVESFDSERLSSYERSPILLHREQKWRLRMIGNWLPEPNHNVALGIEYASNKLGLDSHLYSNIPASTGRQKPVENAWRTKTLSLFGEYQWAFDEKWTAFLGGRLDDHTYVDYLFSPRAALVYAATEVDSLKFMLSRSQRIPFEDNLRDDYLRDGRQGEEESIDVVEFRYERQQGKNVWGAVSYFLQTLDLVGKNSGANAIENLGSLKTQGLEFEITYQSENFRLGFSQTYVELIDFSLRIPETIQPFSSEPYGFGDDLANWSNHETKLYTDYRFNSQLSFNTSLRIYWGFPGAEDQADFNNSIVANGGQAVNSLGLSDEGYNQAFKMSAFLSLGLLYQPTENLDARMNFHNVLGWFDQDLNKRNYVLRMSEYRSEAAAVSVTLKYRF